MPFKSPSRIEPAVLGGPIATIADLIADLSAAAETRYEPAEIMQLISAKFAEIIMGVRMRTQIKQRHKEAEIKIPHLVMEAASLSIGQVVDVRAEGGRIIIATTQHNLDELLAEMTPDTFHDQVDFGRPVGQEETWLRRPKLQRRVPG